MTAFYSENDPAAAHVLRCLITEGLIAPGVVDDRSIKDVRPDDLDGFTQCHFFAGAGVWSVAARLAGWPDERPLWTGSCPCQPFSAAGRGLGTDDPRHLWPDFFRLIRARRPPVVVGEQVAGQAGYGWLDGVRADLAAEGYASRGVDIPACAVDAPHIRQRLYWCAVADAGRELGRTGPGDAENRALDTDVPGAGAMADADRGGRGGRSEDALGIAERRTASERAAGATGDALGPRLERQRGDEHDGRGPGRLDPQPRRHAAPADGRNGCRDMGHAARRSGASAGQPEAHHGKARGGEHRRSDGRNGSAWADHEWLTCHDGKARRTEPGLRLLVDGMAGRIPAWRLGGNSIVASLAAEVLAAFLDDEHLRLTPRVGIFA